ncbi:PREDICTED: uncharacterized protein LOC108769728 [Trachymyrmex cornetzi]|uniref:uncharacterized protein LOC108769728 n=1 Tax=Trachymyrmex cornetzi TaxID=471704 RepID=UPI00084F81B5|nr:PREDICTED: uncharacterized protein LOC108769728 [Trachymyrmex cornetzi]
MNHSHNYIVGDPATEPTLELFKVQWRMPHVALNEVNKLSMLRALESGRYLSMSFRSWKLYEYSCIEHDEAFLIIKTATQLEKPRYVIFTMQTNRKNNMTRHKTHFDHCKLTNVKLYLNSEFYPYDDPNLDFDKRRIATLYDMYIHFRWTCYEISREIYETLFNLDGYAFVIIDCSRQNVSVKSGTVDVRLEFEFKENVAANITAYCLIIYDRVIEYSPMSNVACKIT